MELIQISYRILFDLTLEVEGIGSDVNQYIIIDPTPSTQMLLTNYNMLIKQQKNSSVFLIETEPVGPDEEVPRIMLESDEVFRFQVKFSDSEFFNGTHLGLYNWTDNVLVVTNEVNHIDGTDLLLSVPIVPYNNSDDYLPGFLVTSGGVFYKALQVSNNGDPHPVTDTDYWKLVDDGTAISQADLQTRSSLTYPVDLDTVIIIEVKHSALLAPDYQLLDVADKCREVSYKIKLLRKN